MVVEVVHGPSLLFLASQNAVAATAPAAAVSDEFFSAAAASYLRMHSVCQFSFSLYVVTLAWQGEFLLPAMK